MKPALVGILTSLLLGGCGSWPQSSQGGAAENYFPGNSVEDGRFAKTTKIDLATEIELLDTKLETARSRLDLMIFEGALDYFPAAVDDASRQHQRAQRAFAGALYYDSHVDSIVLSKMLSELERRMIAIGLHRKSYPWDLPATQDVDPLDQLAQQLLLRGFVIKRQAENKITIYPLAHGPFAFESAEINEDLASILSDLAAFMQTYDQTSLRIEGHTDELGTEEYNDELSELRALIVTQYLQEKGIDSARLQSEWYGENQPLADNSSEHNRQLNRRVELTLSWQ